MGSMGGGTEGSTKDNHEGGAYKGNLTANAITDETNNNLTEDGAYDGACQSVLETSASTREWYVPTRSEFDTRVDTEEV